MPRTSKPSIAGRRALMSRFRAFVFDVDGTLMHGPAAIPGAAEAIRHLRDGGKRIAIATNNSTLSGRDLVDYLGRFGIAVTREEVVSVIDATADWLAQRRPGAAVLVVGSPALKGALAGAGLDVRDDGERFDFVVTGGDRGFDYARLTQAVRAVLNGAQFVATNRDGLMIERSGIFPGGGAIAGAIAGAIGRPPDAIIGKPSSALFLEVLRRIGLPPAQCVVVGDSIVSDIQTAHECGMGAVLVLSGVTSPLALETLRPTVDLVLDSVADLVGV